ncbi:energy transducer TonB [Methylocapsa sp. S129]|uniref:cell envelope integrity protein TolA n=1 Tax=Methylocapsa sp. S129 TaxID=1641869 RepID=UPI00131C49D8|nr:energy transducer TonB [Methylocapsa sp. S129]
MSDWRDPPKRCGKFRASLVALRWTAAAAVVTAVHGGVVWVALNWQPAEAAPGDPPPAVMIELAPLPVAPEAPPQEVAPGPQMTEAQPDPTPYTPKPAEDAKPDPTPPPPEKTVEDAKPDPTPPVTPTEPAPPDLPPVPVPEPQVKVPDLLRQEHADAILAPPPSPTPPATPQVQTKPPPPKKHEVERKKPVRPDTQKVRQTTAPPTSEAQRSNTAAAPSAGASSAPSISPASWKGELMAHLNRYKRYPPGAGVGTASVAFTINRSGEVLSARLIGSSGDSALDEEAVALVRRANPVPSPPPDFGGGSIALTVPIRFNH